MFLFSVECRVWKGRNLNLRWLQRTVFTCFIIFHILCHFKVNWTDRNLLKGKYSKSYQKDEERGLFTKIYLIRMNRCDWKELLSCGSSQGCFWLNQPDASWGFNNCLSSWKESFGLLIVLLSPPRPCSLVKTASRGRMDGCWLSVPSVVTFRGTLMQWDITQPGSTRRATAKARTQLLRIYHPYKRPLPLTAEQE